jgi:hypothetical protein
MNQSYHGIVFVSLIRDYKVHQPFQSGLLIIAVNTWNLIIIKSIDFFPLKTYLGNFFDFSEREGERNRGYKTMWNSTTMWQKFNFIP